MPLARSSVYEVIKALDVKTSKMPAEKGQGGGRIAWLSSADADRVKTACQAVDRGEMRISELRGPSTAVDTRLIPFSEWYERQGIARSTAFKLLQITGITPAKQRSENSRTPINALDPEQLAQLNACAERLQDGETMAQLSASFPSRPREHQGAKVLGLDLAKATLPDAIAAMVEAWYQAQGVA
jgi:predicted DNA-binding transcriptional regulator AlpA